MPNIVSIVYTPSGVERKPASRYARIALERATLVEGHGIDGDLKGSRGSRQLNIMRAETLIELASEGRKTGPGEMGEQLIIAGLDPEHFIEGTRLHLGSSAIVEIGIPRTDCDRFERIQGTTKQSVAGRLGVLARVIKGGEIAIGDEVRM